MGLVFRLCGRSPSSHASLPILRLFFDECASVAIRVAASLAASHLPPLRSILRSAGGYFYLLLSLAICISWLSPRNQAIPPALSVYARRCRERRVLALFEASLGSPTRLAPPISTSFRGPSPACTRTACCNRPNDGCPWSSTAT